MKQNTNQRSGGSARRPGAPARVLKFGGTSLDDAERMERVSEIVAGTVKEGLRTIVVVSATAGTTDALDDLARRAVGDREAGSGAPDPLDPLRRRHEKLVAEVAGNGERAALERRIQGLLDELREVRRGIRLLRECSARSRDRILSFGERLSAVLMAGALRKRGLDARTVDPTELIVTDDRHGTARADRGATERRVRAALGPDSGWSPREIAVVPGFVGATPGGDTTTLGRGGSDYTATLLGAALDADRIEIWTDVDGIMTADPRAVPDAESLTDVSYEELLELSSFGAQVVQPPAIHPAREAGIPLLVRNSLAPDAVGTRVGACPGHSSGGPVRGISAVDRVVLLRLEGIERVGALEVVERQLRALRRCGARLLLLTRDCSGHSVSFALAPADVEPALEALEEEFEWERKRGLLDPPTVERERAVLAVVGEGMRKTPGVAGRFFSVLGREGVNIHAIAQGSSERNISCVVDADVRDRALRAVHRAFFSTDEARAAVPFPAGRREEAP